MEVKECFAQRLKILREDRGLSQAELAEKVGVSRGSISFYENGDRVPDIEVLSKIQKYFDVDFNYLLGASQYKTIEDKHLLEDQTQLFSKLFSSLDRNLYDVFIKDLIKILSISDERAKKDFVWNIVLTVGFHLRILDQYNKYTDVALKFKQAIDKNEPIKINLNGLNIPNTDINESYYMVQRGFYYAALYESKYIHEETDKLGEKLFSYICELNDLYKKYGKKYDFLYNKLREKDSNTI